MRKLLPLLLFTQVVLNPQFIWNTHGEQNRPNILFCISDDQSYAHTGANGDPVIQTPAFDRVAREGIRFTRAFCDAPRVDLRGVQFSQGNLSGDWKRQAISTALYPVNS